MAYFDCQIVQGGGGVILTVTCHSVFAGTTIIATDGETTLSQTCPSSSPYEVEFKLPNAGTWTISGVISGTTYTTNVVIPSTAELNAIPNGATATPTDVIQTWLHCANIWDKNYTTISQVLADGATVTALIASNNAADYMARSTSWANSVVANSSAMTKIGANDYCANKLLANSTWLNAICNSTYFESVLNVKVPTMTSYTNPSGEVFYFQSMVNFQAWMAFNSSESQAANEVVRGDGTNPAYIGYDFTRPILVKKVKIDKINYAANTTCSISLVGSNDRSNWTPLSTGNVAQSAAYSAVVSANTKFRYFAIRNNSTGNYIGGTGFQFYGRE